MDLDSLKFAGTSPGEGRHPNETPLARQLAAAFAARGLAETRADLQRAGVPSAEAQSGDSELFLNDPHTLDNDMVAITEHPVVGRLSVAWRSVQFGGTQPTQKRPTPLLGEHTDEVMAEVGYQEAEIRALHAAGVIKREMP